MDEIGRILDSYKRRDINKVDQLQSRFTHYVRHMQQERERIYTEIVNKYITDISSAKIMEIGAGDGINLRFFESLKFKPQNIYANELRPEMCEKLKSSFPNSFLHTGNALDLTFKEEFDLCFQSTVFTSILSADLKQKIAGKMFEMTKKSGIILWYDFIYDNPWNKDVKGIKKEEIKNLFPKSSKITFYNVILAPPIGRRVGMLYPIINFLFPFLRTHVIAVIEK